LPAQEQLRSERKRLRTDTLDKPCEHHVAEPSACRGRPHHCRYSICVEKEERKKSEWGDYQRE
jgi:hypothetical protein